MTLRGFFMQDQTVGFVGLGAIGTPMAVPVARTFETLVWNRTSAKAKRFSHDHAARVAATATELVHRVDAVITCR